MTDTQQATALTREYKDTLVPLAGIYDIDPKHSTVEFVARHLMITKVRGRFEDVDGTIQIGDRPEDSSVEVSINATSVSTGQPARDEHLRSGDFFEAETHPTWKFKSTSVEYAGDGTWKVTGDLTIKGVTRPVVLDTEFEGANKTPWGTNAVGFTAAADINREDWGLTYNMVLETGGVVVGNKIRIELNVEAAAREEGQQAAS